MLIQTAADSIRTFFYRLFSGVTWLFVVAHLSHHVITALVVPLLPFMRNEFGLDYVQAGFIISAFSLSYGIAQLPAGWMADRLGPHKLITLSISGVAFAGLMVGLSQVYVMVIVFLVLMGLLGGGYHPSASPLISASVRPENRGFALGCHLIGGSSSYFLSPLIGAYIATYLGWRGAFISLAIPIILFGLVFHMVLGRRVDMHATSRNRGSRAEASSATGFRYRAVVAFMFLSTFTSAVLTSTVAFLPLYMVDRFHVQEKTAAAFVAFIYLAGIWAAPLGGYLSDRMGRVPMILMVCFLAGPVFFLLNIVPFGIGFGLLLLTMGSILMMRMPVSEAYIVSEVPDHLRSTVLGIYFFCAIEGGGVLTPVMGVLVDGFGFYHAFSTAAASVVLVTLVCSFFLREGNRAVVSDTG
jgi:MFS family permease